MSIRILLADDHKIFREGIRTMIQKMPNAEIIAEASDGRTTVELAKELLPEVVIMDIAMPGLNGIEAARQIIAKCSGVKVIALSMYSDKRYIREMLSAGVSGYLLKDCAFEELAQAIKDVVAGRIYLSLSIADIMAKDYAGMAEKDDYSAFSRLTNREREVLQLLAEGNSTKEIAYKLSLSIKTIETYRQQIMEKLHIRTLAELIKYAIREGITTLDT